MKKSIEEKCLCSVVMFSVHTHNLIGILVYVSYGESLYLLDKKQPRHA